MNNREAFSLRIESGKVRVLFYSLPAQRMGGSPLATLPPAFSNLSGSSYLLFTWS